MASHVEKAPRATGNANFTPSDALVADAGLFAGDIARFWPRPHAPYFAADRGRRRLMQVLAGRTAATSLAKDALATWSAKRLLAAFMPDAPHGFVEALRKSEDAAWTPQHYAIVLDILAHDAQGAKILRHAVRIDRALLHALDVLPPDMRRMQIVKYLVEPRHASLFAKGVKKALSEGGHDPRKAERMAQRLERARSTASLFRALIAEIGLQILAPPPIPGAGWLQPIATENAIKNAALRFQNCLAGRIGWLLCGHGAYYEVVGDEPAIVEIVRDRVGLWTVGEIRGHANADVSPALYARVIAYLEGHGATRHAQRPSDLALALAHAAALHV